MKQRLVSMGKLKNLIFTTVIIGFTVIDSTGATEIDNPLSSNEWLSDTAGTLRPIRQATQQPQKRPTFESLSLAELILVLMAKHGQATTSSAFSSLDQKSLGEVMRILLVEVDKPLAADIVAMQEYAQNSDKQLVAMIAKIVVGDSTASKDIFMWDEKLRKFPWWVRIRQRMFLNLDKYVGTFGVTKAAVETTTSIPSS